MVKITGNIEIENIDPNDVYNGILKWWSEWDRKKKTIIEKNIPTYFKASWGKKSMLITNLKSPNRYTVITMRLGKIGENTFVDIELDDPMLYKRPLTGNYVYVNRRKETLNEDLATIKVHIKNYAKRAKKERIEAKAHLIPEISVSVIAKEGFKLGSWGPVEVIFENTGKMEANDIYVEFSGPIDAQKTQTINQLKPGKRKSLTVGISPRASGRVPLEITLFYKDIDGDEYQKTATGWIEVVEREEKVFVRPQQIFNIGKVIERVVETKGDYLEAGAIKEQDVVKVRSPTITPKKDTLCPYCNQPIKKSWKACPACGARLSLKCPYCESEIQPGWKACPACGEKL